MAEPVGIDVPDESQWADDYARFSADDCRIEVLCDSPMIQALCDLDIALRVLYRTVFDAWRPVLLWVGRRLRLLGRG